MTRFMLGSLVSLQVSPFLYGREESCSDLAVDAAHIVGDYTPAEQRSAMREKLEAAGSGGSCWSKLAKV